MNEEAASSGNQIVSIPVDSINPSPYQPRTYFDDVKLKELADSIKEKGVLQPVTVRKVEGASKPYELVMGERRLRASILAGVATISSIVRALTDGEAREIALVENLQRDDLTAIEEARSVQALVEVHGGNKAEAARRLGKPDSYVYHKLALLTLPEEVQMLIDSKVVSEASAKVILEITSPEKQIEAANLVQRLDLSATQLRARMQKHLKEDNNSGEGNGDKGRGTGSGGGVRKATSFKALSASMVATYEAVEGFNVEDLVGDDKGLKEREMLRKQTVLLKQSVARLENALLRPPPPAPPMSEKGGKGSRPPKLSAS